MPKYSFTYPQRYAVWHFHEERCWLCTEPLRLVEASIDHVLPESLLNNETRLQEVLTEYGLPATFNLNGFENWLPCHVRCNQKKADISLKFVPGTQLILDRLVRDAQKVERAAAKLTSDAVKDRIFASLFAAFEEQTLTVLDLANFVDAFAEHPRSAGVPDDVVVLDNGYWVRREDIAQEGLCKCERNECVGHNKKVYCYFARSLPAWVIGTGLYHKCYDEFIVCPRCGIHHKRGHIGTSDICGRPYLNQECHTD